ncbi:Uu.00g084920.m01.CDS01 [Anthostomella pinea]|uniref:Uu.00g084920.m01.CDS01 n=1 Tax=Anthostomella pinea TaxID=933095 RepID=A0AAI8YJM2_9PEZI|nr:Uu.00g084920.m01.CDS01 [Anthostomella pinea]
MAEAFGIITGAAGLIDVCIRLGIYVREVRKGATTIQQELDSLLKEVSLLETISKAVKDTYIIESRNLPASPRTGPPYDTAGFVNTPPHVWKDFGRTIDHCSVIIAKLYEIVKEICGSENVLKRVHKRRSKEDDLRRCKSELVLYYGHIQILFSIISREDTRYSQKHSAKSFDDLTGQMQTIQGQISDLSQSMAATGDSDYDKKALEALRDLHASITSATEMIAPSTNNEFFSTPKSVSSIFTGRETLLYELTEAFIQTPGLFRNQLQRRFVVHGMGGSGKTQFCCKFAEDNRDRFWGVFWIDGSSEERIKKSLGEIAKLAGRHVNPNAALHWLSNIEKPWLLLIDNADDPDITLEDYFLKGKRGHILITTRNPGFRNLGNIEPRYYDFSGLQLKEASSLLLKASELPVPWESTVEDLASTITKALGHLVLAIVQAGAAIRSKLCSLQKYLDFHERSLLKLRKDKRVKLDPNYQAVWANFELGYEKLEARRDIEPRFFDALELLHVFAFFYRERLSPDVFTRAIQNAQLEIEQQEKTEVDERSSPHRRSPTMMERFQPKLGALVLTANWWTRAFEDRIRVALNELVEISLIDCNEADGTYSMHPVVHNWARKRPQMSLADQALWADMAGYVLAASILLPPLGTSTEDEQYHVSLKTHIEHVQTCREDIVSQLVTNSASLWLPSFVTSTADADRLRMYAKFSLVYAQCGQVNKAKPLLKEVAGFLNHFLGPQNKRTRDAHEALSAIYWILGKVDKALTLQRGLFAACEKHLGRDHPDTLRALHKLGVTL